MKINDAVGFRRNNPIDLAPGLLEEIHKRHREAMASKRKDEAMQKVEEVRHSNMQASLEIVDRHLETVRKSRELFKELDRKRAIERLAQKQREEHSEVLIEMAIRRAERRDLLEAAHLKKP